jgi:hypothetical protein
LDSTTKSESEFANFCLILLNKRVPRLSDLMNVHHCHFKKTRGS